MGCLLHCWEVLLCSVKFFYCIAGNVHKYFHGIDLVKEYTKLNLNMNYVCTIKFSETVINISLFSS